VDLCWWLTHLFHCGIPTFIPDPLALAFTVIAQNALNTGSASA